MLILIIILKLVSLIFTFHEDIGGAGDDLIRVEGRGVSHENLQVVNDHRKITFISCTFFPFNLICFINEDRETNRTENNGRIKQ